MGKTLSNGSANKVQQEDRPIHDWYRFVLSFPPHLVREYLDRFEICKNDVVLDPFCGTGTTLVECKKLGIPSIGVEANPMAQFACRVKCDWTPSPQLLCSEAKNAAEKTVRQLEKDGVSDVALELSAATLNGSLKKCRLNA